MKLYVNGIDCVRLLLGMLKLLVYLDLVIKKVVYYCIVMYVSKNLELFLFVVNILM